jgi:hypothetical protein
VSPRSAQLRNNVSMTNFYDIRLAENLVAIAWLGTRRLGRFTDESAPHLRSTASAQARCTSSLTGPMAASTSPSTPLRARASRAASEGSENARHRGSRGGSAGAHAHQFWMAPAAPNSSSTCSVVSPRLAARSGRNSLSRLHSNVPPHASWTRPPTAFTGSSTISIKLAWRLRDGAIYRWHAWDDWRCGTH